jgi:transcriptional regulator with XRE-family HTH domain
MFGTSLHSVEYDKLRGWLKNARKAGGLTMEGLAKRLGVHRSAVGKLEGGERNFELFKFISYCDALGVDPVEGFKVALDSYRKAHKDVRGKK